MAVYAVPHVWNALPEDYRLRITGWIASRWDQVREITAMYGRSLYSGLESGFGRLNVWVQTVLTMVVPSLAAAAPAESRGSVFHVFPPYEVRVHGLPNPEHDPAYWRFPVPGM